MILVQTNSYGQFSTQKRSKEMQTRISINISATYKEINPENPETTIDNTSNAPELVFEGEDLKALLEFVMRPKNRIEDINHMFNANDVMATLMQRHLQEINTGVAQKFIRGVDAMPGTNFRDKARSFFTPEKFNAAYDGQ